MTDKSESNYEVILGSKYYVKILYRVKIVGGPILKGSETPETMDFVTGYGHVIPGLEKRLLGHRRGDKLSFVVPPREGFGERHQELIFEKSWNDFRFPEGFQPYPGMQLPLVSNDPAAPDTVLIREVRESSIVIDCNHPLAGLSLEYDLEIIEARPARATDICSEWDEKESNPQTGCSSCSPYEILLPGEND
mgnify:CR=1 FL=1